MIAIISIILVSMVINTIMYMILTRGKNKASNKSSIEHLQIEIQNRMFLEREQKFLITISNQSEKIDELTQKKFDQSLLIKELTEENNIHLEKLLVLERELVTRERYLVYSNAVIGTLQAKFLCEEKLNIEGTISVPEVDVKLNDTEIPHGVPYIYKDSDEPCITNYLLTKKGGMYSTYKKTYLKITASTFFQTSSQSPKYFVTVSIPNHPRTKIDLLRALGETFPTSKYQKYLDSPQKFHVVDEKFLQFKK